MRDTPFATEIRTAIDSSGQAIERILVKEHQREEIRFSWWRDGKLIARPLHLPENELLQLLRDAIKKGVFSAEFLKSLHEALYDSRHEAPDAQDLPR